MGVITYTMIEVTNSRRGQITSVGCHELELRAAQYSHECRQPLHKRGREISRLQPSGNPFRGPADLEHDSTWMPGGRAAREQGTFGMNKFVEGVSVVIRCNTV